MINKRHQKEIETLRKKYEAETRVKLQALEKTEILKEEIRSLESGNANASAVRQLKQICRELQSNNDTLRAENEALKAQLSGGMIPVKHVFQSDHQNYRDRLEQSINESQIAGTKVPKLPHLRDTGQFASSFKESLGSSKAGSNKGNRAMNIQNSVDSKHRKGGTPSMIADLQNVANPVSLKTNQTVAQRNKDSKSMRRKQDNDLQTPSMKSDLNMTFNKGPRYLTISSYSFKIAQIKRTLA